MDTDRSSFLSAYKLVFYLFILCLIRPMIFSAKPTIPIIDMIMSGGPYRKPSCSPPRTCLNLSFFFCNFAICIYLSQVDLSSLGTFFYFLFILLVIVCFRIYLQFPTSVPFFEPFITRTVPPSTNQPTWNTPNFYTFIQNCSQGFMYSCKTF